MPSDGSSQTTRPGCDRDRRDERHDVKPTRSRHEEHRGERRAVDERRPDVRLHEHEHGRDRRQPDRPEHRADLPDASGTLREEPGHGENDEELAELGRLEGQRADAEPPLRAARLSPERDHEQEQEQGDRVELAPVAPEDVGVEERHAQHRDAADGRVDRLPDDVVVGAARHVVARDPRDEVQAVADERRDRSEEDPVEVPDERLGARLDAARARPRAARACVVDGHQSVSDVETTLISPMSFLKYLAKTSSAAGAADVPPWPPFSTSAHTTISGSSAGP